MSYTLDVRGDMTFVKDDTAIVGMVRPGPYEVAEWSSWTPNWRVAGGYELAGRHESREQALADLGYHEVSR